MSEDKRFVIGDFEFENYYEYRAALEDVKKIEYISNELDLQDPEVAVRLYNDIRDGIITFNGPVGQQFADHMADIVAHKSVDILDNMSQIEEAEGQAKNQRVVGLIFVGLAVVFFVVFASMEVKDIYETRQVAQLQEQRKENLEKIVNEVKEQEPETDTTIVEELEDDIPESNDITHNAQSNKILDDLIVSPWDTNYNEEDLTMNEEFADLYDRNKDFVGWLEIVDTDINYPVMQTPNDPEYYLRKDFNGGDDPNGTLFADYRCDLINPTTNTLIYGHNMRSGKMFGGLKKYLNHDYYMGHKTIRFSTLYFEEEYEVVGVGLSVVGDKTDDDYKYYDFIDAVTGTEFQTFLDNIQSMSAFDETIDIVSTDKLLTLSTCNSYKEDGRLFIVAKRIK